MNKLKHLAKHTILQSLYPDTDKECWMAFQVLKVKYPNIKYMSHNGYHCDGLVDYTKGVSWSNNKLTDVKTKEILTTIGTQFYNMNTADIVNTWMRAVGETSTTKGNWLSNVFSLFGGYK